MSGSLPAGFPMFDRYIGIDYSGARTPKASLKGLRVYDADRIHEPVEVTPDNGPGRYWSRRGLTQWLLRVFCEGRRSIVGIDHAFSFPQAYFDKYGLKHDWPSFLRDFQKFWPAENDTAWVKDLRKGTGSNRRGESTWKRQTELWTGRAKSVFHFDVPGQVAKSTHAGLPWILHMREKASNTVHFWPFDGWKVLPGKSVVAEVYPALWRQEFVVEGLTGDQNDAYAVAAWLRKEDLSGKLGDTFETELPADEKKTAGFEGWILGVVSDSRK